MNRDPREVLGVHKRAGIVRCQKAYRRLVQIHHPDKNPGDETARARFEEVQEAWDQLNGKDRQSSLDESKALANLCALFINVAGEIMSKGGDPNERDVKQLMSERLAKHKSDVVKRIDEITKQQGVLRKMMGRWESVVIGEQSEHPMEQVIANKVAEGDVMLGAAEADLAMVEASIELLAG